MLSTREEVSTRAVRGIASFQGDFLEEVALEHPEGQTGFLQQVDSEGKGVAGETEGTV